MDYIENLESIRNVAKILRDYDYRDRKEIIAYVTRFLKFPTEIVDKCLIYGANPETSKHILHEALKRLSNAVGKTLYHPQDVSFVIKLFIYLREHLIYFNYKDIADKLINIFDWKQDSANRAAGYAEKVAKGTTPRTAMKGQIWRNDAIDKWFPSTG